MRLRVAAQGLSASLSLLVIAVLLSPVVIRGLLREPPSTSFALVHPWRTHYIDHGALTLEAPCTLDPLEPPATVSPAEITFATWHHQGTGFTLLIQSVCRDRPAPLDSSRSLAMQGFLSALRDAGVPATPLSFRRVRVPPSQAAFELGITLTHPAYPDSEVLLHQLLVSSATHHYCIGFGHPRGHPAGEAVWSRIRTSIRFHRSPNPSLQRTRYASR
jgi:hypothetical protein